MSKIPGRQIPNRNTAVQKTVGDDETSKNQTPEISVVPKRTTVNKTVPKRTASKETISKETTFEETISEETLPESTKEKVDTTANLVSRSDIYLLSQQANRIRQGVLRDIKEQKTDFDGVLKIAEVQKPISRMRMSRILKALGWKKRHFTIAINVLKLPVDNRLEWWTRDKNAKHLKKLKNYYENGELRESVSERFPWSN